MRQKIQTVVVHAIKVAITFGVLAWILHTFGWNEISSTLRSADPFWVSVGVVLFIISIFLGALQWGVLLQNRGISLPLGKTISLSFTGIFFSNFMLGMVAGDSYRVAHIHFRQKQARQGFAATFFDRVAGLLVISAFAVFGGLYLVFTTGDSGSLTGTLALSLLFALLLVLVVSLLFSQRLQNLSLKIARSIPFPAVERRMSAILQELFIDRHDAAEKHTFRVVLFYSFWIQFIRIVVHITAAASLGLFAWDIVHYFFIIIPIISFLTIIPLPFGIKEAIGGTLFLTAGFALNDAVVMQFIATLIGIAGSLVGGITFLLDREKQTT